MKKSSGVAFPSGLQWPAWGIFLLKGLSSIQQAALTEASGPFYGLQTRSFSGTPIDLAQFAGNVALGVNVASKCGLTPQ